MINQYLNYVSDIFNLVDGKEPDAVRDCLPRGEYSKIRCSYDAT